MLSRAINSKPFQCSNGRNSRCGARLSAQSLVTVNDTTTSSSSNFQVELQVEITVTSDAAGDSRRAARGQTGARARPGSARAKTSRHRRCIPAHCRCPANLSAVRLGPPDASEDHWHSASGGGWPNGGWPGSLAQAHVVAAGQMDGRNLPWT